MGGDLESSIWELCGALGEILDEAESSSRALTDIMSERPIHLESATTAFLQKLDRMTEEATADLQHLESMTSGALSFVELLGHCGETIKVYGRHADAIEERLKSFGYVPPVPEEPEVFAEKEDAGGTTPGPGISFSFLGGSTSVLRSSTRRRFDDDDNLFESFSLENIGLSDACLATLSAQDLSASRVKQYGKTESTDDGQKIMNRDKAAELMPPPKEINGQGNTLEELIRASKEEYDQLPSYMKALASWEELQEGVSKLNSYFNAEKAQGRTALNQDDIGTVGLGTKGRAYLLILLRLNQLTMEPIDGSVLYTLRKNDS